MMKIRSAVLLSFAVAMSAPAFLAAPPADTLSRKLSSFDPRIKPLLARMTLEEKIGQMTQPDQEHIKDLADIENLALGSILSGGSSDPKEGNSLASARPLRHWPNISGSPPRSERGPTVATRGLTREQLAGTATPTTNRATPGITPRYPGVRPAAEF